MSTAPILSAYKQLRPAERAFVDAYLSDLQALAVAAGQRIVDYVMDPANKTPAERSRVAKWHADQMIEKPLVKAAIVECVRDLSERFDVNAHVVLREVVNIARGNIADYIGGYSHDGVPEWDFESAGYEKMGAIQSIKTTYSKDGVLTSMSVTMHSKNDALEKVMRFMRMYDENANQAGLSDPRLAPVQQLTKETTTEQAAELYARTLAASG